MKYTLNDLDKKLEAIQQESQKASDEPRQRLCQNYRKLVSRSKWVEFQQENHTCILNLLAYVDTLYEFAGDSDKGKKILKALREKKELDRLGLSTLRKK